MKYKFTHSFAFFFGCAGIFIFFDDGTLAKVFGSVVLAFSIFYCFVMDYENSKEVKNE